MAMVDAYTVAAFRHTCSPSWLVRLEVGIGSQSIVFARWRPSNKWFLSHASLTPNGISIGSAVFADRLRYVKH